MKQQKRLCFKKFAATFLSALMSFSLLPKISGEIKVSANIRKTTSNTSLGVSQMKSPDVVSENERKWQGSFVYFGTYNNSPIKFRALATNETAYGESSLLLDSYKALFQSVFDTNTQSVYDTSSLRAYLNGTFYNSAFNTMEREAIVYSKKAGGGSFANGTFFAQYFKKTIGLSGDYVFALDVSELTNNNYGYADEGWVKDPPNLPKGWWFHAGPSKNRIKRTTDNESADGVQYWTRTQRPTANIGGIVPKAGLVYERGRVDIAEVNQTAWVAPALNVSLAHIFTSTCISGTPGQNGAEYKLTLCGPNATIAVPSSKLVTANQGTVTVPYKISGKAASNMTNVSVMILDKEYKVGNTNGAKLLFYDQLQGSFSNSKEATGTFQFPSDLDITKWGTDYKVYIVPEQIKGDKETDYAGVPQLININKYDVTFKNDDGTTLKTIKVVNGDMPAYTGDTPTKADDNDYAYVFSGWTPSFAPITKNTTYTATYTSLKKYTITFENYDGTVLQTERVAETRTPSYNGSSPQRQTDERYIYTFSGWSPNVTAVTKDQTYKAQYSTTDVLYKITFVDENNSVLEKYDMKYEEMPAFAGQPPTKDPDAKYSYSFDRWYPAIDKVKADQVYIPIYTAILNFYTITFVDEDGTVLDSGSFGYDQTPVYNGQTPTKAPDAQYTYTFAGWDNNIETVTGDATYTATYSSTVNEYQIDFVDEDGTVLQSEVLLYGETPSFKGTTPTKAADAQYTYTFSDWDKTISMVTGNATYKAVYSKVVNTYEIIFADEDGSVLQKEDVPYGETPSYKGATPVKAADEIYTYAFSGWTPDISEVTKNATYTATFTKTEKPGVAKYSVVSNVNSWKKGSGVNPVITVKRSINDDTCFSHFQGVEADGKPLVKNMNYIAVPGSTVITISSAYLESLTEGKHQISINFDDGSVTMDFAIDPVDKSVTILSKTGDVGHFPIVGTLMVIFSAVILLFLFIDRKRRMNH